MKPEDLKSVPKQRYYDQQLLKVPDFQREQDFHIKSRELQTRFLFTPGIMLGLTATLDDKMPGQLHLEPGLAIDGFGRQIILVASAVLNRSTVMLNDGVFTLDLTDVAYQGKKWCLTIEYFDEAEPAANQWSESPKLNLVDTATGGASAAQLALATIDIKVSGTAAKPEISYVLDTDVQIPAGLIVPAQNISASQIISGTIDKARIPGLPASKIIDGELDIARIPAIPTSKLTGGIDADKIASGTIDADRIPVLSADKITSGVLKIERVPDIPAPKITGKLSIAQLPDALPGNTALSIQVDKPNVDGEQPVTLTWTSANADEVQLEYLYEEQLAKKVWKAADGVAKGWVLTPYQMTVYTVTALNKNEIQGRGQFTVQVIQNAFQYLKSLYFLGTTLADALQLCVNRYRLLPLTQEEMQDLAGAAKRAGYSQKEALAILKTYPQKIELATPLIISFSNSNNNFLIQWNPVPNAEGYELELKDEMGLHALKAPGNVQELTYTSPASPAPAPGICAVRMRAVAGTASSDWSDAVTLIIPEPEAAQYYHWAFDESDGLVAIDAIGRVNGRLTPTVKRESPGCIGPGAVHINGNDDSYVTFGTAVGQFNASDFTVALWFKTTEMYRYFDVVGNRTSGSHGNFFCLRMSGQHESLPAGALFAEVDQDEYGTNYNDILANRAGLNDGNWHHVAVVRAGQTLSIYVDGAPSGEATTEGGVASIANGNDFKLGRSLVGVHDKFAPNASYDELYVYNLALTGDEILTLFNARDTSGDGKMSDGKKLFFDGKAYGEMNYWDRSYRDNSEPNTLMSPINNGFTIEAMIYLTAEGSKLPVITAYLPDGSTYLADGPSFCLSVDNGKPTFVMTTYSWSAGMPSSPTLSKLDADIKLPLNQWARLSVTHDYGGNVVLYVDGKAVASTYFGTSMPNFMHYFIGKLDNNFFSGFITEVRLWRGVKTPSEILKFSTAFLGNYSQMLIPAGLGAYYQLEEEDGLVAKDAIKSNDFKLQNTSWKEVPKA
ncbi:MAG: hypothetical protein JWP58_549 [Hymenobacter sp.]|nr:hypothetical protein [Hymenobacter sp.]